MSTGKRHIDYDSETENTQGLVRRAVTSWVGLLLLVFGILHGGTLPARAAGGSGATLQSVVHVPTIISMASDMAVFGHDGRVSAAHSIEEYADACAFCLPVVQNGFQPPVIAVVLVDPAPPIRPCDLYPAVEMEGIKSVRLSGAASSRAPPHV